MSILRGTFGIESGSRLKLSVTKSKGNMWLNLMFIGPGDVLLHEVINLEDNPEMKELFAQDYSCFMVSQITPLIESMETCLH